MIRRILEPFPALVLMAVTILVACADEGVIDSLSDEQRRDVESQLEVLQAGVGFNLVFPDYLPEGIDPIPLASVDPDGSVATLVFEPDGAIGEEGDVPLFIMVQEYDGPPQAVTCDTIHVIPQEMEYSCTDIKIRGQEAISQLTATGPDSISHRVTAVVLDRSIEAAISWSGKSEAGAPD